MRHHETGRWHPECPTRLESILNRMDTPAWRSRLAWQAPQVAPLSTIGLVHDSAYIRMVEESCFQEGQHAIDGGDTQVSHDSFLAARLSAGAALSAVDAVMGGAAGAFAAGRPPGHHASEARAMGFCLFNNVAIAARYAHQKYNVDRVFILDWDVHHGNGTQDIFYDDPTVLFASLHQYPLYPGTGAATETGHGAGEGYTVNCPIAAHEGWDACERALHETILPKAQTFKPDLVLVSAGYDAHQLDPLGNLQLDTEDFARMTRLTRQLAAECCGGRLACLLEGGYHLEALTDSVEATVAALIEG